MRQKNIRKKVVKGSLVLMGLCLYLPHTRAYAGSLNENEQEVLEVLSEEFVYNNAVYKTDPSYLEELRQYFLEDDVDLTEQQKNENIAKINGNMEEAISEGYVYRARRLNGTETEAPEEMNKPVSKKVRRLRIIREMMLLGSDGSGATAIPCTMAPDGIFPLGDGTYVDLDGNLVSEDGEIIEKAKELEKRLKSGESVSDDSEVESDDDENQSTKEDINEIYRANLKKKKKKHTWFSVNKIEQFMQNHATESLGVAGILILLALILKLLPKFRRPLIKDGGYTDIHTHILPGVDDGSDDMETTMEMLRQQKKQGVTKIIATTHYSLDKKRKTIEELEQLRKQVQKKIDEEELGIQLYLGHEIYYTHGVIGALERGEALTLANSRYVLVEFSTSVSFKTMFEGLRKMLQNGYLPILAHVERYECLYRHHSRERLEELKKQGIRMQVNGKSLQEARWRKLVKSGYIQYIASDCHDSRRRKPNMQKGIKYLGRSISREKLEHILYENTKKIIDNHENTNRTKDNH